MMNQLIFKYSPEAFNWGIIVTISPAYSLKG